MDPKFIKRIFHPFEQENAGITKQYGGSGLGMAITDKLIRLMGGSILVESMPGEGSDFSVYLTLPLADHPENLAADDTAQDGDAFTYEGCNILMAEDNEVNAEIAVSILGLSGASVDVAVNGRDAVEKFAAAPPGTYDFILMDIQMPEDGNIETDLKNANNLLVSPETSDMPSGGNLPQGVGKSAAVIAGTSNNSSDQSVIKLPSGSGKVLKYILADHSGFFTAAEGLEVVRENATADCKELYQLLLGKNLKELEPYSLTAPNLTSVFISAVNPPKIDGNTFGDIPEALDGGLHVIVPEESLALYQDAWREVPDSEVIDQLKTAVNILWGILLVVLLFKGIGIVLLEFRHLITERRLLGILELRRDGSAALQDPSGLRAGTLHPCE